MLRDTNATFYAVDTHAATHSVARLQQPAPSGEPRLRSEIQEAIDEAYRYQDSDALWRMMRHADPAVCVYAGHKYDMLIGS